MLEEEVALRKDTVGVVYNVDLEKVESRFPELIRHVHTINDGLRSGLLLLLLVVFILAKTILRYYYSTWLVSSFRLRLRVHFGRR
jgi:hypothetical protein